MPEESTNSEYKANTRTRARREIDASSMHDWKTSLKPNPMRGYSLSVGQRRTRAMMPTRERGVRSDKLNIPAWYKPYSQALLETDPEILVKLLAATEEAVFERLLEFTASEETSDEKQDIRRAIDVILTLKTRADSKTSFVGSPGVGLTGMRDRVTVLGGSFEIASSGKGTIVKVVIPLQEPTHQNGLTRSATEE